jgi:trimeric autotransporter adhesin
MKLVWKIVAVHIFIIIIFLAILAAASSAAAAPGGPVSDADWTPMNSGDFAGTNGPVYAQVWYKGYLYVGGNFTVAGNIPCNNIARFNGTAWDSLGPGTDSAVCAIAFDSSGNLYAGGFFLHAGKIPVNQVARWNGKEWGSLGAGPNTIKGHYRGYASWISAIVVGSDGSVYVGGQFESINNIVFNNIAKWNGNAWSALGAGIHASRSVAALVIDGQGNLIAGGEFDTAGGLVAHCVAKWDGNKWDSTGMPVLTSGETPRVSSLAIDKYGNLYAGGFFTVNGTSLSHNIVHWNGNAWIQLGSGIGSNSGAVKTDIKALAIDREGRLYAGGRFNYVQGDTLAKNIAMWDGTRWASVAHGFMEPFSYDKCVASLAFDDTGRLYAGGCFKKVQGKTANNIARWTGAEWNALGVGIAGPVNDTVLAIVPDRKGNVYCGGTFRGGIAKWDGAKWDTPGGGINGSVSALCMDSGGNVYAAGLFDSAGTHRAKNIAKWDGAEWSGLDLGLSPGPVCALVCDARGNVYAGGAITKAGRASALCVAKWDGNQWDSLGLSLAGKYAPSVSCLAVDKKGNLCVAGNFNEIGPYYYCRNIVAGNGTVWDSVAGTSVGSYDDVINAIVFDKSGSMFWLDKAGYFPNAENTERKRTIVWALRNGKAQNIGEINGYASAMAIDDNDLVYVAGFFSAITNSHGEKLDVSGIARWNSVNWEPLGSGLRHFGNSLAAGDSTLFVGGPFAMAGTACSPYIAKLDIRKPSVGAVMVLPDVLSPITIHYGGRLLRISNAASCDRFELYSLSGKRIRQAGGATHIDCKNITPQPVIFRILRGAAVAAHGMFFISD